MTLADLRAEILEGSGKPEAGLEVTFLLRTHTFPSRLILLGRGTTDDKGIARPSIMKTPKIPKGTMVRYYARVGGDARHAPAVTLTGVSVW